MQQGARTQAERRADTRAGLLAQARALFSAQGFAGTGTEEIVQAAAVTRGALYFHFADKVELFAAVLDEVAREIAAAIDSAAAGAQSAHEALMLGSIAYVRAAAAPERQLIYLVEGPSVLGLTRWHEMENRHSLPLLQQGLAAAFGQEGSDVETMSWLMSGAMVEAARRMAADPSAAERIETELVRLLGG